MNACRVAGFAILGLGLLMAGLLGAPPVLLAMIGGFGVVTAFLPGGGGAAATRHLGQKIYDRRAWEAHLSEGHPRGREERPLARVRSRRRTPLQGPPGPLPP